MRVALKNPIGPAPTSQKFDMLVLPFMNRLYRTALILTKSPRYAKQLVHDTYAKARRLYHKLAPDENLEFWMFCTLKKLFNKSAGSQEEKMQ